MSWEQEISELLQEAQEMAVRFDIQQQLTSTEKARAKANIDISASASQISGNDYKISFS